MKTLTRKDITPEMFNKWKDKCRKEFLSEPDSMNLINLMLQNVDTNFKADQSNARLMEFYENELTDTGKLCCEKCGGKMEVYYTSHCFRCTKPDGKNYFKIVNWLAHNEPDFEADLFWRQICRRELLNGNDSYMKLPNSDKDDDYGNNLKFIKKHFDIKKPMFVSW